MTDSSAIARPQRRIEIPAKAKWAALFTFGAALGVGWYGALAWLAWDAVAYAEAWVAG